MTSLLLFALGRCTGDYCCVVLTVWFMILNVSLWICGGGISHLDNLLVLEIFKEHPAEFHSRGFVMQILVLTDLI